MVLRACRMQGARLRSFVQVGSSLRIWFMVPGTVEDIKPGSTLVNMVQPHAARFLMRPGSPLQLSETGDGVGGNRAVTSPTLFPS